MSGTRDGLSGALLFLNLDRALFPADGATVELILNAADNAMYLAKKAGRNCYVFATAGAATSPNPPSL